MALNLGECFQELVTIVSYWVNLQTSSYFNYSYGILNSFLICTLLNAGITQGLGARIADDQFQEYLNLCLVKSLSPQNVTPEIIESRSKSMYFSHQMRVEYLQEMKEVYARKNKEIERKNDFDLLLKTMEELHLFEKQEGRKGFDGFENMPDNMYIHKNIKDIYKWCSDHLKKFVRIKHFHTDHTLNVAENLLDLEEEIDNSNTYINDYNMTLRSHR